MLIKFHTRTEKAQGGLFTTVYMINTFANGTSTIECGKFILPTPDWLLMKATLIAGKDYFVKGEVEYEFIEEKGMAKNESG